MQGRSCQNPPFRAVHIGPGRQESFDNRGVPVASLPDAGACSHRHPADRDIGASRQKRFDNRRILIVRGRVMQGRAASVYPASLHRRRPREELRQLRRIALRRPDSAGANVARPAPSLRVPAENQRLDQCRECAARLPRPNAKSSGVRPLSVDAPTSAPAASSASRTARFSCLWAARCRGVKPSSSRASISAPAANRASTTAGFSLYPAAQCQGSHAAVSLGFRVNPSVQYPFDYGRILVSRRRVRESMTGC